MYKYIYVYVKYSPSAPDPTIIYIFHPLIILHTEEVMWSIEEYHVSSSSRLVGQTINHVTGETNPIGVSLIISIFIGSFFLSAFSKYLSLF